jgi:hypothetical protein
MTSSSVLAAAAAASVEFAGDAVTARNDRSRRGGHPARARDRLGRPPARGGWPRPPHGEDGERHGEADGDEDEQAAAAGGLGASVLRPWRLSDKFVALHVTVYGMIRLIDFYRRRMTRKCCGGMEWNLSRLMID